MTDYTSYPPPQFPPAPAPVLPVQPRRSRRVWWWAALAIAVIAGIGIYIYTQTAAKLNGASSPEAAVEKFLNGLDSMDTYHLVGAISPLEWDAFGEIDLQGERSDYTDEEWQLFETQLEFTKSLRVDISDLSLSTTEIEPGLATVHVESGDLDITADTDKLVDIYVLQTRLAIEEAGYLDFFDEDDLEEILGTMREEMAAEFSELFPLQLSFDDLYFEDGDGNSHAPLVVTTQEKGRWYISPSLTFGEIALVSADAEDLRGSLPDPNAAKAGGSSSPEEVLPELAAALPEALLGVAEGDIAALNSLLPAPERRFASLYLPAFTQLAIHAGGTGDLKDLADALTLAVDEVSIDRLSTNRAIAVLDKAKAQLEVPGESVLFEVEDGCFTADYSSLFYENATMSGCVNELTLWRDFGGEDLGFVLVQEHGRWFLSLPATMGNTVNVALRNILDAVNDGRMEDPSYLERLERELDELLVTR